MSGFVSLDTFVIQFVILCLVLWVLKKFVFVPYLEYLDGWEEKQKQLEDDYKNIDGLISEANTQKEEILSAARKKSEAMITEAESIAKTKQKNIVEKAESQAADIVESGKKAIESEKLSMLGEVKTNIVDLIIRFNTKMFGKETVSRDFVEREIELMK